ncbi:glycosyltransferase family 2 protein [Pediococcus siamensis]|uniref:glycosyltransferase family 2 protein n=1 Tax=Pediococcus siamensis TaxID=381829 RepID=UPI0039A0867F
MNDIKISVIVPVYNASRYLARCLDSIKEQNMREFEVVLINDGSTDGSLDIIKPYLEDKRFRLINQENRGISFTRNHGIDVAMGEYIVFVDADDFVFPDYLSYLFHLIVKFNAKISSCAHESINPGAKVTPIANAKEYFMGVKKYFENLGNKTLPYQMGVSPWGRMYKKSLFENIKYPNGKKFEDSSTTYRLMLEAGGTAVGEKIKYLYYRNASSIVQKPFTSDRFEFLNAERQMTNDIAEHFPEITESMNRRYQYALMNTLAHIAISPNQKKFVLEQKKLKAQILNHFTKKIFDKYNRKKDVLGLITLRVGLPVYRFSFFVFKKLQKVS